MYVYRTISFPEDSSTCMERAFKRDFNEGFNLLNAQVISPSSSYFFLNQLDYSGCNSFFSDSSMYKYFYPSLADAIYWSGYLYYYSKVIILEMDLPIDKIIAYSGLGYYGRRKTIELKIPYGCLHDLVNTKNLSFNEALKFFNNHDSWLNIQNDPAYQELMQKLKSVPVIPNLSFTDVDPLYKYLCFKIDNPYQIRIVDNMEELCQKTTNAIMDRDRWYYDSMDEVLQSLMEKDYSQVENEVIPYLAQENETLKRVLRKHIILGDTKC